MVYEYGGLDNGASSELVYYTGEFFTKREDVVFVSVNHRLNILGYLDLSQYGEQYATSAIAGEEDCREALRWVHDNIAQFGGDPSNVTILGQSGGGAKVTALACMSDTTDLFQKVFVMSGAFVSNVKADGLANTKKLVDYLGLKDSEVVSKLTSMTYEELYKAYKGAGCSWSACAGNGTFATPMFDENGNVNPYAAQRQWMIGTTFSEFSANTTALVYSQDMNAYLPNITDDVAASRLQEKYGDRTDAVIDGFPCRLPHPPAGRGPVPECNALWRSGTLGPDLPGRHHHQAEPGRHPRVQLHGGLPSAVLRRPDHAPHR